MSTNQQRQMQEQHNNEQYFFDDRTVDDLCRLLMQFDNPCLLCAPTVARAMHERGRDVRTLDIDQRFADLPGFRTWDINKPQRMDEQFDLILCDPPFFNVSLSRLFDALRILCHYDFTTRILISYLVRRRTAFTTAFRQFDLTPTDYRPGYNTVTECKKNEIEFLANWNLTGILPAPNDQDLT